MSHLRFPINFVSMAPEVVHDLAKLYVEWLPDWAEEYPGSWRKLLMD
jgi:hypothetical protein